MAAYNETAAHSDDIHEMMIENPDVQVLTPVGGERGKANTIHPDDILTIKSQKSGGVLTQKSLKNLCVKFC